MSNVLSRKRLKWALQYWNEHGAIRRDDGLIVGGMHLNFEPIDDDMSETVTMALEFLLTPTNPVQDAKPLTNESEVQASIVGTTGSANLPTGANNEYICSCGNKECGS